MAYTSIQISPETRDKIARLKGSSRETYDEVLGKLAELIPSGDDEGAYSDAFRVGLMNARLGLKAGRVVSHAELKQRLGL